NGSDNNNKTIVNGKGAGKAKAEDAARGGREERAAGGELDTCDMPQTWLCCMQQSVLLLYSYCTCHLPYTTYHLPIAMRYMRVAVATTILQCKYASVCCAANTSADCHF
ncbi:unnamed protein product, partial [Ceratitis capitata]